MKSTRAYYYFIRNWILRHWWQRKAQRKLRYVMEQNLWSVNRGWERGPAELSTSRRYVILHKPRQILPAIQLSTKIHRAETRTHLAVIIRRVHARVDHVQQWIDQSLAGPHLLPGFFPRRAQIPEGVKPQRSTARSQTDGQSLAEGFYTANREVKSKRTLLCSSPPQFLPKMNTAPNRRVTAAPTQWHNRPLPADFPSGLYKPRPAACVAVAQIAEPLCARNTVCCLFFKLDTLRDVFRGAAPLRFVTVPHRRERSGTSQGAREKAALRVRRSSTGRREVSASTATMRQRRRSRGERTPTGAAPLRGQAGAPLSERVRTAVPHSPALDGSVKLRISETAPRTTTKQQFMKICWSSGGLPAYKKQFQFCLNATAFLCCLMEHNLKSNKLKL